MLQQRNISPSICFYYKTTRQKFFPAFSSRLRWYFLLNIYALSFSRTGLSRSIANHCSKKSLCIYNSIVLIISMKDNLLTRDKMILLLIQRMLAVTFAHDWSVNDVRNKFKIWKKDNRSRILKRVVQHHLTQGECFVISSVDNTHQNVKEKSQ